MPIIQLTSTLPTRNIDVNCTYSELMKIKANLELLFATREADNIISNYVNNTPGTFPRGELPTSDESWAEELYNDCSITDNTVLYIIESPYRPKNFTREC